MKYILIFSLFIPLNNAVCPNGTVEGTQPNICYKFLNTPTDWYSAEDACAKMGGHLSSVLNAFENSFLLGMGENGAPNADDYWIGGNNNNLNSTWGWTDKSNFSFTYWAPGKGSWVSYIGNTVARRFNVTPI